MAVRRAAVVWVASLLATCGLLALPLVAFAATSAVTIQGSAFNPPTTTVHVGDSVTWTNHDTVGHTSTSDTAVWDSPVLGNGGSFQFTFTVAGTFTYHCSIHRFMTGSIVVLGAATPQPTVPPTPVPTPVRTNPPTVAPTAPPTAAPTSTATESPTTPPPSVTPSPTPVPTNAATPSTVAEQLTPAPNFGSASSPGPLLIGAAALAVVGLGAIAFVLARRR